jgi:hypothetical protein
MGFGCYTRGGGVLWADANNSTKGTKVGTLEESIATAMGSQDVMLNFQNTRQKRVKRNNPEGLSPGLLRRLCFSISMASFQ